MFSSIKKANGAKKYKISKKLMHLSYTYIENESFSKKLRKISQ